MSTVMHAFIRAFVSAFSFLLITFVHADEKPTPYFYRVTKNGSTSYLLGTIHRNVSLSDLSPSVVNALKASNSVVVEVTFQEELLRQYFSDPWSFREHFELEFLGISPQQHTKEAPTSETLKRLNALNFPKELNNLVRNDMCDLASNSRIIFVQPKSLDFEIQKYAYAHKKPMVSLDSPELVEGLKKNSEDYLACNLNGYIARTSVSEIQDSYQKMRDGYLTQTLDGLGEFGDDPEIVARNQFWISHLPEALSLGSSFIAVGVGHLYGEGGIIRLLQNIGFEVVRIEL